MGRFDCSRRFLAHALLVLFIGGVLAAPASAATARTFLIFFDWGSAKVSSSAQDILKQVAQSYAQQHARLVVEGNCDTSERTPDKLSLERAKAIRAGLRSAGASSGATISLKGAGTSDPMVPTGPDEREPRNRRAVITVTD